ncbi:BLUF domain-containing protein [Vibrio ostreicida]|uniref:BLUF domain-containing protein n=1 Tax=Vibrio ostreicida TaxID=526588 RepID=UPI001FE31C09|nr:BLUF domain-containing protein [Vibrio ostreicida]
MIRLIYVSTVNEQFNLSCVDDILSSAQRRNTENNVSGVLYFNCKFFMQYLEGESRDVEETYQRIVNDKRHCEILLLDKTSIEERLFNGWSMAYVLESELIKPLYLEFMDASDFDPYKLSPERASQMIDGFRKQLPTAYLKEFRL